MSYLKAKQNCDDNMQNIMGGVPANNPLIWNLSAALWNLSGAIESDLIRISEQVEQLRREVRALAGR